MTCRFFIQPLLLAAALAGIVIGGWFMWLGGVLVSVFIPLADQLVGAGVRLKYYKKQYLIEYSSVADGVLYVSVALALVLVATFLHKATSEDILILSETNEGLQSTSWLMLLGGAYSIAMLLPIVGTTGHELAHRVKQKGAFALAQVVFALMLNPNFPIAHVFSHHRQVAIPGDCETAFRGESYWRFLGRSLWLINQYAYQFEAQRSAGLKSAFANRVVIGGMITLAIWGAALLLTGLVGLLWLLGIGIAALVTVQLFQYVGHYGLVRMAGAPVCARHSWQWPHVVSSGMLVNITRHPDHHLHAGRKYHSLRVSEAAPIYPFGPVIMVMLALVPPLFYRAVRSELARWDRDLASDAELSAIRESQRKRSDSLGEDLAASNSF